MNYELHNKIASTTETSPEIITAIAERGGDDEDAILLEWAAPSDEDAIIRRAADISGTDAPLYWGSEGRVA